MISIPSLINVLIGLLVAPFLLGIINRTKALFAGRNGQPLLQPYFDIIKLMGKGAVYSRTTSWIFRAGPTLGLACSLVALTLVPLGGTVALLSFDGDLILMAYLFGFSRFCTIIAALDTGSSFEGMGASRETLFSALAEPALFIGLAAVVASSGSLSLSTMLPAAVGKSTELILVAVVFFVVFLCENSRIPFDDPNTHLELTMIHEVMVLDHSGPDFAFITYGAAIKLWVLGSLIVSMLLPATANLWQNSLVAQAPSCGFGSGNHCRYSGREVKEYVDS
jgi:formate hydrogenlyase subunit 4